MNALCEALMLESIEEDEYIDDPIVADSIHYLLDKEIDKDISCIKGDGIFGSTSVPEAVESVYGTLTDELNTDKTIPDFVVNNDEEVDKALTECYSNYFEDPKICVDDPIDPDDDLDSNYIFPCCLCHDYGWCDENHDNEDCSRDDAQGYNSGYDSIYGA
jgi:hypothetical protein